MHEHFQYGDRYGRSSCGEKTGSPIAPKGARSDGEAEQRCGTAKFLAAHRNERAVAESMVHRYEWDRRRRKAERRTRLRKPAQRSPLPLAVAGLRTLSYAHL